MSERVRTQIESAAKLLGLRVRTDGGDAWGVREGVITVGTAAYGEPVLSDDALTALVLLDVWVVGRQTSVGSRRTSVRRSLAAAHPEYEPLLVTLDRLQAAGELLRAFPGFREGLSAAMRERLSTDLTEFTLPEQWVATLLIDALAPGVGVAVLPDVSAHRVPTEVLWAAMTPLEQPDAERTFERLLGVTLPHLLALLAAQGSGLVTHSAQAQALATEADTGGGAGLDQGGGADEANAVQSDGEAGEDGASAQEGNEQTRAGDAPEQAEGADLFEAQQAGDVKAMLETPLPLSGEAAKALHEWIAEQSHTAGLGGVRESVRADRALQTVRVSSYRARAAGHSADIEALRVVLTQIIGDRLTVTHRNRRVAEPEGEALMREALPAALAEVHAGVSRPRAYTRRERVVRQSEEPGNLDVVILIDRSGSMRHVAPVAADAALVVVEALAAVARDVAHEERRLGVDLEMQLRTALIVFDAEPVLVKPIAAANDDASRARLFSEALTSSGGTNDAKALALAAHELGLDGARARGSSARERERLMIVISDGGSDDEPAAQSLLGLLRAQGVTVFGIGMRSDELVQRYAPTSSRVDDPRDIVGALERLITGHVVR